MRNIAHPDIRETVLLNNDPQIFIPDLEKTVTLIRAENGIAGIVCRTIISGMASTATKSTGVQIVGIDPEEEKKIFTLDQAILQGTGDFFEKDTKYNPALIGESLAKELKYCKIFD